MSKFGVLAIGIMMGLFSTASWAGAKPGTSCIVDGVDECQDRTVDRTVLVGNGYCQCWWGDHFYAKGTNQAGCTAWQGQHPDWVCTYSVVTTMSDACAIAENWAVTAVVWTPCGSCTYTYPEGDQRPGLCTEGSASAPVSTPFGTSSCTSVSTKNCGPCF